MSNYIVITDYEAKDNLLTGNPAKLIKGAEFTAEFNAIATAISTKADSLSPTLTTPNLGVATATSINKVTITAPATGSTLTVADGKTLTASNSLTLAGADGTTLTFPPTSATIARTDAAQTFTGVQTFTSPAINGTVTTTGLTLPAFTLGGTITSNGQSFSGTIANLGTVTTVDINGGTIDGTTQASGTINGPLAVGGTWTAAATWTLPALTLGGAITGNSQNVSGLGTLGCGAITSTGAIAGTSLNIGTGALTAGTGVFSCGSSPDVTIEPLSNATSYSAIRFDGNNVSTNMTGIYGRDGQLFVTGRVNTYIAVADVPIGTFSSTGLAVTGTGSFISADANDTGYFKAASGMLRMSGYINGTYGSNISAVNLAGSAYQKLSFNDSMFLDASGKLSNTQSSSTNYSFSTTHSSNAQPYGIYIDYTGATPNGTANDFLRCHDTGADRALIRSNGGLANYSANNVNLSDGRLKTDWQDADIDRYYNGWLQVPFGTYLYNDQTDTDRNLGTYTQKLNPIFPELVDKSGFGTAPEGEEPYQAIWQTDFQFATACALQRAIQKIEELSAKVAALEAK